MIFARIAALSATTAFALLFGGEGLATAQALPTHNVTLLSSLKRETGGPDRDAHARYVQLPMAFEAAGGGQGRRDDYLANGPGYRLALSPREAVFQLGADRKGSPIDTLMMRLVGADASAHAVRSAAPTGHANYFMGKDRGQWRTGIPLYSRVEYRQVYRGIDLVYYGSQHRLEYDFLVRPGVDPKRIALKFTGARTVRIAANGDLVLGMKQGDVRWHRPLTYQTVAGHKRMVSSSFTRNKQGEVGFQLARYDTSRPLVIDPKLIYSKMIGGYGIQVNALAVDSAGSTYLAGECAQIFLSGKPADAQIPVTPGAFQTTHRNAFVAKLNPAGTAFLYATYLGGSSEERAYGIALDSQGDAYVTGLSRSTDFPVTSGAFQTTNLSSQEVMAESFSATAFVTKLNPTGSALVYSTFLGGHLSPGASDIGVGIAVDSQGSAYVTGGAGSADFPTTLGAYQPKSTSAGTTGRSGSSFVTKLNPAGTALVYSTYLGGSAGAGSHAIALDSQGDAYVTGVTVSTDFPVTPGAFQPPHRADRNPGSGVAFVTKLNAAGTAPIYSTFLGGNGKYGETGTAIAVDKEGSAYVAGTTDSTVFPTTPGAFEPTESVRGGITGSSFVTKLPPDGSALVYSTYLGGDIHAIAVNSAGSACVTGDFTDTLTPDFPTTVGAVQRTHKRFTFNGFVTRLNATGTALIYSTYLHDIEVGYGIAIDHLGIATVSGNAYVNTPGFGGVTSYVTRLATHPVFPDFNGDGSTDLLLKNRATGVIGTWFMNGADVVGGVTFSQIPPASFNLVGVGDFYADGATTLVFQNSVDNGVVFWYTGGDNTAVITGGDYVARTVDASYKLAGVADFSQDGRSDLLFQNQTTGRLVIWNMKGPYFQSGVSIPQTPGADWKVVGTGDFNGDGFADIVFQSRTTGKIKIWFMQGAAYVSEGQLLAIPAADWSVVGVGDYNGDGYADLLLQNQKTNQAAVWYLNGILYQGGSGLSLGLPSDWKIVGPH